MLKIVVNAVPCVRQRVKRRTTQRAARNRLCVRFSVAVSLASRLRELPAVLFACNKIK